MAFPGTNPPTEYNEGTIAGAGPGGGAYTSDTRTSTTLSTPEIWRHQSYQSTNTSSTFVLTLNGNNATIDWNEDSVTDVQTAMQTGWSIGSGNVLVSQNALPGAGRFILAHTITPARVSSATANVKTAAIVSLGSGLIKSVKVTTGISSGTLTIYNNWAPNGPVLATLTATTAMQDIVQVVGLQFTSGCCIEANGAIGFEVEYTA